MNNCLYRNLHFYLFVALFVTGINKGYAQHSKADSLKKVIAANPYNDDKKATDLFNISAGLIDSDPKKSLVYIDQILSFEKNIRDFKIITGTYRVKGVVLISLSNYPEAINALNTAYKIDKANKHAFGEAGDLANLATVYLYQSNFLQALKYYQQAAKILETIKSQEGDATAVNANIAVIYIEMGNYDKALEYFEKALAVYTRLKNKKGEVMVLANIGNVYERQKNYEKAILYCNMSIKIADSIDDKVSYARETGNLANYLSKTGKYDQALKYALKAIELNKAIDNKKSIGYNLQNVAEAYRQKGDYSQAKAYGLAALKMGQDLKIPEIQRDASEGLSKIYDKKSKPDSALYYFKQFTLFKDSIGNSKKREEITRMSIQFDFDKKEFAYKQQQLLSDEQLKQQTLQLALNNADLQKGIQLRDLQQIQLQNEKLQTEKKQKLLIISQNKEKLQAGKVKALSQQQKLNKLELNQLWLFGILAVVVLVSILLYLLNLYRIRQLRFKNTLQNQQAEQHALQLTYQYKLSESELKAIRSQMNPHFIFNVLNSIESYVMDSDKKTASRLIQKFAALSRLILENSTRSLVTADKEWKALILYTELEAMRYNNSFSYHFEVADEVQLKTLLLPPMLIQPLIENAILHGLIVENKQDLRLEVSITSTINEVKITVKDNGVGILHAQKTTSLPDIKEKSLGIKSIKERIEMINLQYHAHTASFMIEPALDGRGTIAMLTLPLLTTFTLKETI